MRLYLRLAWRNIWRHRRRTIIIVTAMGLGLSLMMMYDGLVDGFNQAIYGNAIKVLGGNIQVHAEGYGSGAGQKPLLRFRMMPLSCRRSATTRVVAATPDQHRRPGEQPRGAFAVGITAIEPELEQAVNLAGQNVVAGRGLTADDADAVLIGKGLADAMGVAVGDRITVTGRSTHEQMRRRTMTVIGVYDLGMPDIEKLTAYISLAEAQALYDLPGQSTEVAVFLDRIGGERDLIEALAPALPGYEIASFEDSFPELQYALASKGQVMDIFSVIILGIAGIGILNLLLMAVYERTREIGVLGALGLKPRQISLLFILEGTFIGLVGVAAGIALGLLFNGLMRSTGLDFTVRQHDELHRTHHRQGLPKLGGRPAAEPRADGGDHRRPGGRHPGRRGVAARPSRSAAPRLRVDMIQLLNLAFRNLGRHRRRSFFSALAMGMALALLLLMSSVLKGEYGDAIDLAIRLQSGHLQFRAASYDEVKTSLQWEDLIENPDQIAGQIASLAPVAVATPRLYASGFITTRDESDGVRVIGIDPASAANAPYSEGMQAGEFLTANDREGVLIGLSLANRLGLTAGDRVNLSVNTSNGDVDEQSFIVRGIYSTGTTGFDGFTVLLPLAKAQAFTRAENRASTIFVLLTDTSQTEAVIRAVQAPGFQMLTWQEMNELLVQTEELSSSYMVFFYLIVLGIAATVIVNTQIMSVYERTREIGILSAIGMRGRRILTIFLAESGLLAVGGILLGLAIGGAVVAYFTRFGLPLDVENFGITGMLFQDKIYAWLTVQDAVRLTLMTFLITLLAGLYPAVLASRMEPVAALRAEK
jgi:ABC-type lipoprotein release transport system permease subunit